MDFQLLSDIVLWNTHLVGLTVKDVGRYNVLCILSANLSYGPRWYSLVKRAIPHQADLMVRLEFVVLV